MPRNKGPSLGRCMFLISSNPCTIQVRELPEAALQGHLAHEKPPPLPGPTIGAWAYSYCRDPGGSDFL